MIFRSSILRITMRSDTPLVGGSRLKCGLELLFFESKKNYYSCKPTTTTRKWIVIAEVRVASTGFRVNKMWNHYKTSKDKTIKKWFCYMIVITNMIWNKWKFIYKIILISDSFLILTIVQLMITTKHGVMIPYKWIVSTLFIEQPQ